MQVARRGEQFRWQRLRWHPRASTTSTTSRTSAASSSTSRRRYGLHEVQPAAQLITVGLGRRGFSLKLADAVQRRVAGKAPPQTGT